MKARQVDDHPFVGAVADFLDFVASGYIEFDEAAIDFGDHGFGSHAMANRSSRKVTNIDPNSNGAFARIEIASHRI